MQAFPKPRIYWLLFLVLFAFTSACSSLNPGENSPQAGQAVSTSAPALPTSTPEPSFTATATETATLSQTPTVTPTRTPTPHPMSIPALRKMAYPGSEVIIEETLEPGSNYDRYYASYLSEGLRQYGLLTIPYGETPPTGWPAIVFNHGYIPPNEYRTTERYVAYVDWLARSGYIVFRIDYRGHDQSEGFPSGAYGSPGYTIDVINAVAALQQFPPADNNRIGMWGHSMGGFLTLRAMVVSPDIKAGVVWAGVVASYPDLFTRWRRGGGPTPTPRSTSTRRWRSDWTSLYGSPDENPKFWEAMSANSYLADLSGPLQLHHGTSDETVPLEFSEILYQQLQEAEQTAEYYEYPDDNHNLSNSFSTVMRRTIEFYDRYLKGE